MRCPTCQAEFERKPWPATHQTYCSIPCMKRAYYLRHKSRIDARTKRWCREHRDLRLEVQRRWNAKASAKVAKRVWQRAHYKAWYAAYKANGGIPLNTARGTSRRRLVRHQPEKICVCRGRHEGRIECHHKDGNPFNTLLSNLEWRCLRHHRMKHGLYREPKPQLGVRGSSRRLAQTQSRTGS